MMSRSAAFNKSERPPSDRDHLLTPQRNKGVFISNYMSD